MMAAREDSLDVAISKATNPLSTAEDWEHIINTCDRVNREPDGPQTACRILAHKIHSPVEWEALLALTTLEACVKHCGKRFHCEVGKFRFLNELIKCVSPKYLGSKTSANVKKRIIELMYYWTKHLPEESKITEAYTMLKRQGIVTEDPVYVDKMEEKDVDLPSPRPKHPIFDDDERSKTLARLLRSKNAEDLQAANRMIKNMVKEDEEKIEKKHKRASEIETVRNSVQLLSDMLSRRSSVAASEQDDDLMKELYNSCDKMRPNLFRLAAESDEHDQGLAEILKANDELGKVMAVYRCMVEGSKDGQDMSISQTFINEHKQTALLSLEDEAGGGGGDGVKQSDQPALIDSDLFSLGISSPPPATSITGKVDALADLLGSTFPSPSPAPDTSSSLLSSAPSSTTPALTDIHSLLSQHTATPPRPSPGLSSPTSSLPMSAPNIPHLPLTTNTPRVHDPPSPSTAVRGTAKELADKNSQPLRTLDALGQEALLLNLPADKVSGAQFPSKTGKVTLSQLQTCKASSTLAQLQELQEREKDPVVCDVSVLDSVGSVSEAASSPVTGVSNGLIDVSKSESSDDIPLLGLDLQAGHTPPDTHSNTDNNLPPTTHTQPRRQTGKAKDTEEDVDSLTIDSLTDITIPLEGIEPSDKEALTLYNKNKLHTLIYYTKNKPRRDVNVIALTTTSKNTVPVTNFTLSIDVPKDMLVKQEVATGDRLGASNPILPPSVISQVVLIANPKRLDVKLSYKISYVINEIEVGDSGQSPVLSGLKDS